MKNNFFTSHRKVVYYFALPIIFCFLLSPLQAQESSSKISESFSSSYLKLEEKVVSETQNQNLPKSLSLNQAIQFALSHRADFKSLLQELHLAELGESQQGFAENPELSLALKFAAGDDNTPELRPSLGISQNWTELYWTKLRKQVAKSELDARRTQLAMQLFDEVSQLKVSYYKLWSAEQMLRVVQEQVSAAATSLELAKRQKEAGNISEADLAASELVLQELQAEELRYRALHKQAQIDLSFLCGAEEFGEKVKTKNIRFPSLALQLTLTQLQDLASKQRLELLLSKQQQNVMSDEGIFIKAQKIPPLNFGVELEREADAGVIVGPNFSTQLPFSKVPQAKLNALQVKQKKSEWELVSQKNKIKHEIQAAYTSFIQSSLEVKKYKQNILPLYSKILEEAQKNYNYMLKGVFELLQIRREQLQAKQKYYEALQNIWLAKSELEKSVGGDL